MSVLLELELEVPGELSVVASLSISCRTQGELVAGLTESESGGQHPKHRNAENRYRGLQGSCVHEFVFW